MFRTNRFREHSQTFWKNKNICVIDNLEPNRLPCIVPSAGVLQRLLAVYLSSHVIIQRPQHGNHGILHEVSTVHSYLLRRFTWA